jgi:dTDP-4-dehydrorhamnose reductase
MLNQQRLELWGGFECSLVRLGHSFRDLTRETGHADRTGDLRQLKSLGITKLRYPILWETIAPDKPDICNWAWHDARLAEVQSLGLEPIAGLLHHGSGPSYTALLDPEFPLLFARHAQRVAARYPWMKLFTPVNEPLTTARFSCLYGHWYPHRRNMRSFLRATVNQCKAVVLAMRAIRLLRPDAELIQTEDLGKVFSTPALSYQAEFENERRWLTLDLLCGQVDREHPWYETLLANGIGDRELGLFLESACAPDLIGINHYVTSDRFLDQRVSKYSPACRGGNGRHHYADVEAIRIDLPSMDLGWKARLSEAWTRYRLPIAATEVHLGCTREDQLRWLAGAWTAAQELRSAGHDIRAITVWALLGSVDWSSLLVENRGHYEPGAFDIRSPSPRQTAIAAAARSLAKTGAFSHPVLGGKGWWRRTNRYYTASADAPSDRPDAGAAQIIIVGSSGAGLEALLHQVCQSRGLASSVVLPPRVGSRPGIDARLSRLHAWAVVNAEAGCTKHQRRGHAEMAAGGPAGMAAELASACTRACIPLVHISSDAVFDGQLGRAYVESDRVSPASAEGHRLAALEKIVQQHCVDALVVRSGILFGPHPDSVSRGEGAVEFDERRFSQHDVISASFAPDLLNAMLDLLIDGERGIWHLANVGEIKAAEFLHILNGTQSVAFEPFGLRNYALRSERGEIMPTLDDALARFDPAVCQLRLPQERFQVAAE